MEKKMFSSQINVKGQKLSEICVMIILGQFIKISRYNYGLCMSLQNLK